MKLKKNGPEYE